MKKHKDKKTLTMLKVVALVMALAAILLVVSMSMAAGGAGGDSPAEAVLLDAEVNSGPLGARGQPCSGMMGRTLYLAVVSSTEMATPLASSSFISDTTSRRRRVTDEGRASVRRNVITLG